MLGIYWPNGTVTDNTARVETVFVTKNLAFRWIDSGTEDRQLEIDLLPLAEVQLPPEPEDDEDEDKIETST